MIDFSITNIILLVIAAGLTIGLIPISIAIYKDTKELMFLKSLKKELIKQRSELIVELEKEDSILH